MVMEKVGQRFRATKDLDIVLCLESESSAFANAFWDFVKAGDYQEIRKGKGEGKSRVYRFSKPGNKAYPVMLELFSRELDALPMAKGSRVTPIPFNGEASSLSAILLKEDYYEWILAGKQIIEELPVVGPAHLIPLKAVAWINLRAMEAEGKRVDSGDIKKHRNDVFRLLAVMDLEKQWSLPPRMAANMSTFLRKMAGEEVNLKAMGLGTMNLIEALNLLRRLYGLDAK